MDFDKMIEELSISELNQLRDKCELKLNTRACDHEHAIRKAIYDAYSEGFNVSFTTLFDDEACFFISDSDYCIEVK